MVGGLNGWRIEWMSQIGVGFYVLDKVLKGMGVGNRELGIAGGLNGWRIEGMSQIGLGFYVLNKVLKGMGIGN